jgi:hypothetical protein
MTARGCSHPFPTTDSSCQQFSVRIWRRSCSERDEQDEDTSFERVPHVGSVPVKRWLLLGNDGAHQACHAFRIAEVGLFEIA